MNILKQKEENLKMMRQVALSTEFAEKMIIEASIFTRKDTIKQGMWSESEIELESEKLEFVRNILQDGFSNIFTISKYRKTYHDALENKTINLDKIDGLGFYLEIEILGDFSKEDYNNFYEKMCGEFSFLNSKIEKRAMSN